MSQIQSNVGLITGIPIQDTVDQLMAIAGRSRDMLVARTKDLENERLAVDRLSSLVLNVQFSLNKLKTPTNFTSTKAASNNKDALTAAVATGGTPAAGSYSFTPLQTAASHQVVSSRFSDLTDAIGDGELRFRFGGHVDQSLKLSQLNGGAGFSAGKIKITDKNGASAIVDLRTARSVHNVVDAINSAADTSIVASTEGDSFKLTDMSGGPGSISIQEVSGGSTAASLGLGGLSSSDSTLTGADVFRLHVGTLLSDLRDGGGVRIPDELEGAADIRISLHDGTETGVDLSGASTLGDVLDKINSNEELSGKVEASISADGARLEFTDLTSGGSDFSIANFGGGSIATQLGIESSTSDATLTGERLVSGLSDTLLSSLAGGAGISLGEVSITDRSGANAVVDLASAETLNDVIDLINGAGLGVEAAINPARSGITIRDTTGGSGSLVIADTGATPSATDLGIAVDGDVESVDSGALHRQIVSEATRLSSLNGGVGVKLGDIRFTDSAGAQGVIDLNSVGAEAKTIGDVIDAINALSVGVEARINKTGDGILITDTAGGDGQLTIADVNGTTAADLRILGKSSNTDDEGRQVVDGGTTFSVDLSDLGSASDGVALSALNSGQGVNLGIFQVTDSTGKSFTIDLGDPDAEAVTVGDVIEKINAAAQAKGAGVTARFNSANTGIELVDTAGGAEKLKVADLGSDTAAADLKIAGESGNANSAGERSINGRGLFTAVDAEKNALGAVVERINALKAGVTASTFFDGEGYRLSLSANKTGAANELLIDTGDVSFSFQEISRPRDAVVQYGAGLNGGVSVSSSNNTFNDLIPGLNLSVVKPSDTPVTVEVTSDSAPLVTAVDDLVKSYNSLRTTIDDLTDYDAETLTTGLLFGRNEVLRVETDLTRLLSGRFNGVGDLNSLEAIGVSLNDKGQLELDRDKLTSVIGTDPEGVRRLVTDPDNGAVAKLNTAIDKLVGDDNALLAIRSDTLTSTIESNNARAESMSLRLDRERERMLLSFYQLEETISRMQSNISSLETFEAIPPLSIGGN